MPNVDNLVNFLTGARSNFAIMIGVRLPPFPYLVAGQLGLVLGFFSWQQQIPIFLSFYFFIN